MSLSYNPFTKAAGWLEIEDVAEWVVSVKKITPTTKNGQPKWYIRLDDGEIVATLIMTTQQIIKNEKTFSGMLLLEMGHRMAYPSMFQWSLFVKKLGEMERGVGGTNE